MFLTPVAARLAWQIYFQERLIHISISKTVKKRIDYELKQALNAQSRRGQSKHLAKAEARMLAKANGEKYQPVRGIFSDKTMKTYLKQATTVLNWIIERYPEVRNLSDCRPYVNEYFADAHVLGLSPSTYHTRIYAMEAVYGITDYTDFGIEKMPQHPVHQSKRTRTESKSDKRYNTQMNHAARHLSAACGARRGGLERLTKKDLFYDEEGKMRIHLREKGGKERDALVLPKEQGWVKEFFETTIPTVVNGNEYMFAKKDLQKNMTLHNQRANYCVSLYKHLQEVGGYTTGEIYYCRKERKGDCFDKGILKIISKETGHNRCDVTAQSYLYDLHLTKTEC